MSGKASNSKTERKPKAPRKLTAQRVSGLKKREKAYEVWDTEILGFLIRVQPSGVKTYALNYYLPDGRRRRYRIGRHGFVTATQARDLAKKMAGKVANSEDVQASRKQKREEGEKAKFRKLGGFLERKYGPWVEQERKTGHETLRRIETCFGEFSKRPLTDINPWIVEKWRATQIKAGKARTTINRDVTALKAALSKAVHWGLIDAHPLATLRPLKIDKKATVRYLSEEEGTRLRRALIKREESMRRRRTSANQWRAARDYEPLANLTTPYVDHLQPMVLLSLNTGLRRGELFSLRWSDIDTRTKTLTVRGDSAKSGQSRHVPLNDEALTVIQSWRKSTAGTGLVFPAKDGGRLDNVRRSWEGVLKTAGISNFRWHDMRHDFASRLVMASVPLNTVRELLGHADLSTTLRYAHLAPEHKAEAVAKLDSGRSKVAQLKSAQ